MLARRFQNRNGTTLAAVVFLVAVLGGMGLTLSITGKNRQEKSIGDVQRLKAYYAAVSGIEWAYQKAKDNNWRDKKLLLNLNGTYTMPDGGQFTITLNGNDLFSTASAGGSKRTYKFPDFVAEFN
ncbi:MAG: hypothetical protein IEMM0002_0873 [bacterium]|nr:MAG: hypothetical protein IEMM0002_0873 [bacterium]